MNLLLINHTLNFVALNDRDHMCRVLMSVSLSGILQLLNMRTSRRFVVNRVTPDMENKLNFIMSKVKFGQQKKYQDWFETDVNVKCLC